MVGGESGPNARPMDEDWVRSLVQAGPAVPCGRVARCCEPNGEAMTMKHCPLWCGSRAAWAAKSGPTCGDCEHGCGRESGGRVWCQPSRLYRYPGLRVPPGCPHFTPKAPDATTAGAMACDRCNDTGLDSETGSACYYCGAFDKLSAERSDPERAPRRTCTESQMLGRRGWRTPMTDPKLSDEIRSGAVQVFFDGPNHVRAGSQNRWPHHLLADRVAELEASLETTGRERDELQEQCDAIPTDAEFGREAEELRSGIENLIADEHEVSATELQRLLDTVDARDSLSHLEMVEQERDAAIESLAVCDDADELAGVHEDRAELKARQAVDSWMASGPHRSLAIMVDGLLIAYDISDDDNELLVCRRSYPLLADALGLDWRK